MSRGLERAAAALVLIALPLATVSCRGEPVATADVTSAPPPTTGSGVLDSVQAPTEPAKSAATIAPAATMQNGTGIEDIEWQWMSVTKQPASEVQTVPEPKLYTLVLRPGGTLSGRADCNTFGGVYSTSSGLKVTILARTEAACGKDSLGEQYLELLGQVVAGGPDGQGGLALETAAGEMRMLFRDGGPASE